MIQISDKTKCCGCTACENACPKNCISMQYDDEGFLYPVVNVVQCVDCGLCEKVCPKIVQSGIREDTSDCYAIQNLSKSKRMTSTAGGAFSLIADYLLGENAVVFAVGYDNNMVVCHKMAIESKALEELRGSKYVQSNLKDTFTKIKDLLKENRKVLFVGTPCQAHGLFNYIGQNENLYIIDLLCLGVSSPKLFAEWIEYLNTKYQSDVINVQFRNKHYGYSVPNVRVFLENGKEFDQRYDSRVHANLFFQHLNVRPSCYICEFREIPRISDFTVGDFNDIASVKNDFDDDLGTTKLWVHTQKGKDILEHIGDNCKRFDISWFYGGYEQFKFVFIRNAIVRIVGIIILFVFVKSKEDLLLYIGLLAATGLIGNISMWTYLPKFIEKVDIKELNIKPHIKETLLYFIPTIATSVYNVADKTMLGLITHNTYENGYYEQANKIVNMAKTVLFSFNNVMTSRMSYCYLNGDKDTFRKMLHKSLSVILFLSIPMFFGISAISVSFVPLFFGEGYGKVVPLLFLCSLMLVIIGISNSMEKLYYTPSGQRALSNRFVIAGACLNCCLNLLLIPKFNSYGATVASVIAEFVITGLYIHYAKNIVTLKNIIKYSYKFVLSGIAMFFVVRYLTNILPNNWICVGVEIISGAAIYAILLVIFRDAFFMECLHKYVFTYFKKLRNRGNWKVK